MAAARIQAKRLAANIPSWRLIPATTRPLTSRHDPEHQVYSTPPHLLVPRRSASQTTTTTTRDITHPDPTPGSATAQLLAQHAPYMATTYTRPTPVFVRGRGSHLFDREGRQYLDFSAGIAVTGLGHCDPDVTRIISEQAETLVHSSNLYYNEWMGVLSKRLVAETRRASAHMTGARAAFICNSGSEANEAAIKFARKMGKLSGRADKSDIVAFTGAFHGRTLGSLSATPKAKYQEPFAPLVPGFRFGAYNDAGRAALDALITEQTCGVMVEPVQGEGGIVVGTDEFLTRVAQRCYQVGAVLIWDEIQGGLGRTGRFWAHAHLPATTAPRPAQILTTAKALGNGFPIAATIIDDCVAAALAVGDHGTTYGGNPLACRVAHHVVGRLANPTLQRSVVAKGAQLVEALVKLRAKYPRVISEIRGRGLMIGVQLTEDPTPIVDAARQRGLLVITAGTNTLRFVPSLLIEPSEIDEGVGILRQAFAATYP